MLKGELLEPPARRRRTRLEHRGEVGAAIGLVLWLSLLVALPRGGETIGIVERLLALAILVVAPLALSLASTPDRSGRQPRSYLLAAWLQPFAAISSVASFFVGQSTASALLALPWVMFALLVALFGLARLLPRGIVRADEAAIDFGLLYLVVGAAWLVTFRLGAHPLGFGDTIVALTAIHFHYAGFAAPILAGMAGRTLGRERPTLWVAYRWVAVGAIVGPPLVAVGITFSRAIEFVAVVVLATSLIGLAVLTLVAIVPTVPNLIARAGLAVSSASLVVGMLFALGYGISWSTGLLPIDVPTMARVHGVLNGLGFAGCGLVAWLVLRPRSHLPAPGIPFSRLASRWKVGPDFFQRTRAVPVVAVPPRGLIDELAEYRRPDFDPDAVDPAIRSFYEATADHDLLVRAEWRAGFRLGSRVFKRFSASVQQMNFPSSTDDQREDLIDSQILPIDDAVDGRQNVRAWVRTYVRTGAAIYVAAYSTHSLGDQTYMNIAFPLPCGNLSSILRLEAIPMTNGPSGVLLTTHHASNRIGDEGVYFANRVLPIRLPMNETIRVWAPGMAGAPAAEASPDSRPITVLAQHDVWLYGIRFLTLSYRIAREARRPVANDSRS